MMRICEGTWRIRDVGLSFSFKSRKQCKCEITPSNQKGFIKNKKKNHRK